MPVRSRFRFAARDWGWPALIVAVSCVLAAALNPVLAFAGPVASSQTPTVADPWGTN